MTGVEILTTEQVATSFAFHWTAALITGFIVFLAGVVFSAVNIKPIDWIDWVFCTIAGLVCAIFFAFVSGVLMQVPADYETQYKITISDEVQLNEFNEKYEIINQDGKIYTVRERE